VLVLSPLFSSFLSVFFRLGPGLSTQSEVERAAAGCVLRDRSMPLVRLVIMTMRRVMPPPQSWPSAWRFRTFFSNNRAICRMKSSRAALPLNSSEKSSAVCAAKTPSAAPAQMVASCRTSRSLALAAAAWPRWAHHVLLLQLLRQQQEHQLQPTSSAQKK
jgi:hypothetical protein